MNRSISVDFISFKDLFLDKESSERMFIFFFIKRLTPQRLESSSGSNEARDTLAEAIPGFVFSSSVIERLLSLSIKSNQLDAIAAEALFPALCAERCRKNAC